MDKDFNIKNNKLFKSSESLLLGGYYCKNASEEKKQGIDLLLLGVKQFNLDWKKISLEAKVFPPAFTLKKNLPFFFCFFISLTRSFS